VDKNDYDVLITDIDENTLRSGISQLVGIQYLEKATKDDANNTVKTGYGYLYGSKVRTIFLCVDLALKRGTSGRVYR
jgi:hypothetical protein